MKKKKLFLLASLAAALAMTSCSSFDEPAALDGDGMPLTRSGERAYGVTNETQLRNAVALGIPDIAVTADITLTQALEINKTVSISGATGKKITSSAPIVCKASANFSNLTINATTPVGQGAINLEAEGIVVELDGVNITQNTEGTQDDSNYEGLGIKNVTCKNTLKLNNSDIKLPKNRYVRAINMYTPDSTWVNLEIRNSHLRCGDNLSMPSTYARVLSFSNVSCDNLVIDNSTLKGAYYVVNINGTSKVVANVTNGSVLDGRAAFNVWSKGFIGNVTESTLIGRNNYPGPTESFANIVINQGASGCELTLTNTVFKMDVVTKSLSNEQYAISFRQSNQKLVLAGYMKIFDTEGNVVPSYFSANQGVTDINIVQEEGFTLTQQTVLPSQI